MISINETVSRQNLWVGNVAKSMTSEGNSALLPANVDLRPPLQQGLINFQLYNKSLKDCHSGNSQFCFPQESQSFPRLRFGKQN